ncbi:MAG: ATPase [Paracoccaceae bacterium]|nr:ATPase [Paracoccaceae bacterium]MDE2914604.1 ATPase [Paracoccaceae bacterium]
MDDRLPLPQLAYASGDTWRSARTKRVILFGMSGLGKTHVSDILRRTGQWFHYSVDYRIGTRYMGEFIVDDFRKRAMRDPVLAELLRSDSISIASKIRFDNLDPLSTYVGKPGDVEKGGIPFDEYMTRQAQHRNAEIGAMLDTDYFARRAKDIYDYDSFVCDTSGSLIEVVDPDDPEDIVLETLFRTMLAVWIRGDDDHLQLLVDRFSRDPKPMYYQPEFLTVLWDEFLTREGCPPDQADPNQFIRWGYRRLLTQRLPRYAALARNWGVTIEADDVSRIKSAEDFIDLIAPAIDSRNAAVGGADT